MVIERRAAQISGHSWKIGSPTSPIEGRAFFIGKPTLAVEGPSFSIKGATPGLEERTLPLERASLRNERSSLRLVPSAVLTHGAVHAILGRGPQCDEIDKEEPRAHVLAALHCWLR